MTYTLVNAEAVEKENDDKMVEETKTVEQKTTFSLAQLKQEKEQLENQISTMEKRISDIDAKISEVTTAVFSKE